MGPVFNEAVVRLCHRYDVAAMPGCFTPTEILSAWEAGADIVKVFPATALGPSYFKDVRGPLPQVRLMPTGGVSLANAGEWIKAGAVAIGVGTALVDGKAVAAGDYAAITASAGAFVEAVARRPERVMSHKVVTFGEIMLRLSPPGFERFFQSPVLGATFGGGEANVAISLAQFGLDSRYVTRVPAHAVGDGALRTLRGEGVNVDHVLRGGERLGIYFAETGASQRASNVIYDRAHASIAGAKPGMFPWADIMADASWFHVTGITPALGPDVAACTREAVDAAAPRAPASASTSTTARNSGRKPRRARRCACWPRRRTSSSRTKRTSRRRLGLEVTGTDVVSGTLDVAGYRATAERVAREFGVKQVAITLRESHSASRNGWSAVLWDAAAGAFHQSPHYDITVVDRIGGGDSFAAGLIFGLVTGRTPEASLRFAVAASALKHTIPGDFNRVSVADVDRLAGGDASGRVQR